MSRRPLADTAQLDLPLIWYAPSGSTAQEDLIRRHRRRQGIGTRTTATSLADEWPAPMAMSSTDPSPEESTRVSRMVAQVFEDGADEVFEYGADSVLVRKLTAVIETYGDAAVSALEALFGSGSVNVEVAIEALRRMGAVQHPPTRKYRLSVLQNNLLSQSARIRFGAALGVAAMNHPDAIAAIRQALEVEAQLQLRRTLQNVLAQLEDTARCRAT